VTQALCNSCNSVVPANRQDRDGRVFLVKNCGECGTTETLISSDVERYHKKFHYDLGFEHRNCKLNCMECDHGLTPTLVFIDLTNRCNMNCPICINNTPAMGYLFEPPIEYFEKIFKHLSELNPRPGIQLFGGEPTMRDDLIDLIRLARKYHLRARVVTNGLKLANEDYCRELLKTHTRLFFAYDGENRQLYKDLHGSEKILDVKHKALENIRKHGRKKTILMTIVAKGYNDDRIGELVRFCHERRDFIRATYMMPLAHTWSKEVWDHEAERMTTEECESIVARAFPNDEVEFIPAGFPGQLPTLYRCLNVNVFPFAGAHPSCESMFMMLSDGNEYFPASRLLKTSLERAAKDLLETEAKLARRVEALEASLWGALLGALRLKEKYLFFKAARALWALARRHVKLTEALRGSGLGKVWHGLMIPLKLALGRDEKATLGRHTTIDAAFNIIILPFEDRYNMETDCLERCPAAFAYVDPEDDRAKTVPMCAWMRLHKSDMMRKIAAHYEKVG
jgi:uncharacterized radical SAM superfamily Fe-S cluster-containing enzyme